MAFSKMSERGCRLGAWSLGLGLWLCMGGQLLLLYLDGKLTPAAALPLHLCGFNGVIALPALLKPRSSAREFLFFPGLPGALGALLFPCPARVTHQAWMNFFFMGLHALLAAAALYPRRERCPRPWGVLWWGNGLILSAMLANRLFDANFLFLRWAPAGTPLAFLHQWGRGGYLLAVEALLIAGILIRKKGNGMIASKHNKT